MTLPRDQQQAVALAGLAQAAEQVSQLARTGDVNDDRLLTALHSIYRLDAPDIPSVYGGLVALKPGLSLLETLLSGPRHTEPYRDTVQYAVGAIQLAGQLRRDGDRLRVLRNRLQHGAYRLESDPPDLDALCRDVATVYQDTISGLPFRIQVRGVMSHLQQPRNADRIRTLLLAAIRSAWLWHQLGGRRWHWLFRRGPLRQAVRELQTQLPTVH